MAKDGEQLSDKSARKKKKKDPVPSIPTQADTSSVSMLDPPELVPTSVSDQAATRSSAEKSSAKTSSSVPMINSDQTSGSSTTPQSSQQETAGSPPVDHDGDGNKDEESLPSDPDMAV